MMLRFHTQTGGSTLTAEQPRNNIVRVGLQALASVLGGTQSLHTNSFDEALCLPTEEAVRVALRTQQIISDESGVANTVDPLAGSYYLEELTSSIEKEAMKYLGKVDELGGSVKAIEQKFFQREIEESAYNYQLGIEREEIRVVGINCYKTEAEPYGNLLKQDPAVEKMQIEKVKRLRKSRNAKKTDKLLDKLKGAAKGSGNLMPVIIECVEGEATLGEISCILRLVFGEYKG